MNQVIPAWPFAVALMIGMLICLEIGRRMGQRWAAQNPEGATAGLGRLQGAMFTLYGLLLAFTFSDANSRFDVQRALIADEANAIETAYLRVDLLGAESQTPMRQLFREYLDARLETYRKVPDMAAVKAALARSERLQKDIWFRAVADSNLPGGHSDGPRLLLPSLNAMFDIMTKRTMAAQIHPAPVIYGLLFLLALLCSVLAGFEMANLKKRNWLHILAYAVVTAASVFVILNLEYPRMGLIRVRQYDQVLMDLRENMQ